MSYAYGLPSVAASLAAERVPTPGPSLDPFFGSGSAVRTQQSIHPPLVKEFRSDPSRTSRGALVSNETHSHYDTITRHRTAVLGQWKCESSAMRKIMRTPTYLLVAAVVA